MKKILLTITMLTLAYVASATYTLSFISGFFYDADGNIVEDGYAAWIIDTQSSDFSDFELELGQSLESASYLDIDERYYILNVVSLDSGVAYFAEDINLDLTDLAYEAGDTFAVVAWSNDLNDALMDLSTEYIFYSEDSWTIPSLTQGFLQYTALTYDATGGYGDYIPNESLTLSITFTSVAVPEPSKIGFILGAFALGIIIIKKRKK